MSGTNWPLPPLGPTRTQYRALVAIEDEFLRAWLRDEEWAEKPSWILPATLIRLRAMGLIETRVVCPDGSPWTPALFWERGRPQARPLHPIASFHNVRVAKLETERAK